MTPPIPRSERRSGGHLQLNDVSFLGDQQHKDRCTHLRHSWAQLNRAQGLGFKMFSVSAHSLAMRVWPCEALAMRGSGLNHPWVLQTVIDRPKLMSYGKQLSVVSGGLITTLVAMGTADESGSA